MKKSNSSESCCEGCCDHHQTSYSGSESVIYGMGLVGAAFHFLPGSSGLSGWAWHIFQTITWPGFLIYHLFELISIGK